MLQEGYIIRLHNGLYRVRDVSEYRAYIVPVKGQCAIARTEEDSIRARKYFARRSVNISVNAEVEIVRKEMNADELREAIEELKELQQFKSDVMKKSSTTSYAESAVEEFVKISDKLNKYQEKLKQLESCC